MALDVVTVELAEWGNQPRKQTHINDYMGGWETQVLGLKLENLEEKIIGEKPVSLFWGVLSLKAHQEVKYPTSTWEHEAGVEEEAGL